MLCAICSDTSECCHETTSLPCGHSFHSACLATWLWRNSSCPMCRASHVTEDSEEEIEEEEEEEEEINLAYRAQELNRKRHLQNVLRRKRISPLLARKIRLIKKKKESIADMKVHLKDIEQNIRNLAVHKSEQRKKITSKYIRKLNSLSRTYADVFRPIVCEKRSIKQKLARYERTLRQTENEIVSLS
jgi:DNA repair exonuclease SbcCD ATPase subunit